MTRSRPPLFGDENWRFQILLRKVEFVKNCRKSLLWKPCLYLILAQFHRLSIRLGYEIPFNVIGPGLRIAHRGTIVVNGSAKIGENVTLHPCVVIGVKYPLVDESPEIGNNVLIGAGAKVIGQVTIADGIVIGANSLVNRSFNEPNITVAGVPAVKISDSGSEGLLIRATEVVRTRNKQPKEDPGKAEPAATRRTS